MRQAHLINCVVCLFLTACSKSNQSTSATFQSLKEPNQVASWVAETLAKPAPSLSTTNPLTSNSGSGRLLNVTPHAVVGSIFTAQQSTEAEGASRSKKTPTKTALKNQEQNGNALQNIMIANPLTAYAAPPQSPALELTQADLSDFKYAGMMRQNEQVIGFVKVENRLFRVKTGDLIGKGRWRVLSLDAHHFELEVAGKPINYEQK